MYELKTSRQKQGENNQDKPASQLRSSSKLQVIDKQQRGRKQNHTFCEVQAMNKHQSQSHLDLEKANEQLRQVHLRKAEILNKQLQPISNGSVRFTAARCEAVQQ